jgi:hypothetical protein
MIDAKCGLADWQPKRHKATTIHATLVTGFRETVSAYSSVQIDSDVPISARKPSNPEFTQGSRWTALVT